MRKLRLITMLSAFILVAAGALGLANLKEGKKAQVAEASEHAIALGNSGKIFLQLNTSDWRSTSSKICLYMFNNSVSKSAWGSFVTPSSGSRFVEYSYSLDFTPNQCIAWRVDPGVGTMGDWCWENDRGNSAIWSTTNDTTFNHVVYLGNYYQNSKWTESGAYDLNAVVKGGSSDNWSVATVNTQLTHAKVNGSDNLEVFGEVSLPANTYFKVLKGDSTWCGSYSAYSSISSNFSGGGESNIHNTAAGTYEFYFDYDGQSTYITDPVIAAADEWSQDFLSTVGCDSTGKNAPTGWAANASTYSALSGSVKNYIYAASAKEDGTYTEQAVARYDAALRSHPSLTKFIVNSSSQARGANVNVNPLASNSNNSNIVIAIVIVSLVSVTAIGGYFFIKRRQEN
ncbi:MAG: hypothetical protein IKP50_05115 [Bacilli bacterium]|nr:hypothetical protein [Bacilli bacterium]